MVAKESGLAVGQRIRLRAGTNAGVDPVEDCHCVFCVPTLFRVRAVSWRDEDGTAVTILVEDAVTGEYRGEYSVRNFYALGEPLVEYL